MAEARIDWVQREVTRVEDVEMMTLTLDMEEARWLRAVVGMDMAPDEPDHPRQRIRRAMSGGGMWLANQAVTRQVRTEVRDWVARYPEVDYE